MRSANIALGTGKLRPRNCPSTRLARDAGHTVATVDTLKSMGLSRAASALGVAAALKEIGVVGHAEI